MYIYVFYELAPDENVHCKLAAARSNLFAGCSLLFGAGKVTVPLSILQIHTVDNSSSDVW